MAGPLQPMRWLVALKIKDGFWKQRWGSNSQLMTDHIGDGENKKIPGHRAGDLGVHLREGAGPLTAQAGRYSALISSCL